VSATEPAEGRILPEEFERELMKKALAALKADGLRKLARAANVETAGGVEDLAARIGWLHRWDEQKIARLILENEPEPREDRAHVERLFPLAEPLNLSDARQRLEYVQGRYIRTGIAKWFVFETVEDRGDEALILRGTLRAFRASVTDDDLPSVVAVKRIDHQIEVHLDSSNIARVRRGSAYEAAAAIDALAIAVRLQPLMGVPIQNDGITGGAALTFASASLFMLDLITSRFKEAGLRNADLTIARFRVDETQEAPGDEASKPRLRAVRFEGRHILDSAPACKLLSDGRALSEVAMTIQSPTRPDGEWGRYPVRIAIENGHVSVITGLGVTPEFAYEVQSSAVAAAVDEIADGFGAPEKLMALAERIVQRAASTGPVDHADMLRSDTND
jgi:hypothetical protein